MAKMKLGDITALVQEAVRDLESNLQLAVHKEAGQKLGKISAITLEQQMRAKGIRRAKSTGTHKKRSKKERAAANRYGSMLDVYYKVWRSKDRSRAIVFAGQTQASYKARFRNDGFTNHHYWGWNSGNSVPGKHFVESSHKIIKASLPMIVSRTVRKAVANPKKYKRKFNIG